MRSECDGGPGVCGGPCGCERDEVDDRDRGGDNESECKGWDGGGVGDAEVGGDESPDESAGDESGGYADDESGCGERGGLPGDGGAELSALEAEGFEHCEFVGSSVYGGDEGVRDGDGGEDTEEDGERGGEPGDLVDACDLDGWCRDGGWAELRVGCDPAARAGSAELVWSEEECEEDHAAHDEDTAQHHKRDVSHRSVR